MNQEYAKQVGISIINYQKHYTWQLSVGTNQSLYLGNVTIKNIINK